jgi:hypothetical protein
MKGMNIAALLVNLLARLVDTQNHFEFVVAWLFSNNIPRNDVKRPLIFDFPYRLSDIFSVKMRVRGPFPCRRRLTRQGCLYATGKVFQRAATLSTVTYGTFNVIRLATNSS